MPSNSAVVRPEDVILRFPQEKQKQSTSLPQYPTEQQVNHLFIHIDEHNDILQKKRANYGIAVVLSFFLGFGMAFLVRVCD